VHYRASVDDQINVGVKRDYFIGRLRLGSHRLQVVFEPIAPSSLNREQNILDVVLTRDSNKARQGTPCYGDHCFFYF